jgi:hypothetical protein
MILRTVKTNQQSGVVDIRALLSLTFQFVLVLMVTESVLQQVRT